ncbi:MAG: hypothetical protein HY263_09910 [Chloroflexi bacterium]|nr:hypothetical protein [Chloroflexota bacterium]
MTANRPVDPIDDEAIGRLVRDVADGWSIPPVRLDQPGWRERVRTPRARRLAWLRGVTARLGQAGAAAIALTLGAALLGVWLTTPHGPGKPSTEPGTTPGAGPSAVAASPLPKLFAQGAPPTPARILVKAEADYAIVDLATGTISSVISGGQWGTDLRRNARGELVCLCLTAAQGASGIRQYTVSYVRYLDDGTIADSAVIGQYDGAPDPRDSGTPVIGQDVFVTVTYGPDAGRAYVGWSTHEHPLWRSGIDVVDTATGAVVRRVALPAHGDGDGNTRYAPDAPRVIGATQDGHLVLAEGWASWSPPVAQNPAFHWSSDTFVARDDGTLAGLAPLDAGRQCGDLAILAGGRPDGGMWLACRSAVPGETIVRLLRGDGTIDDVRAAGTLDAGGDPGSTSAISPDGRLLFLWDPARRALTRVDLVSGEVRTGTATAAIAPNPLAALGRWLTPSADAKVLLSAAIAVSPDGRRVYALGTSGGVSGEEFAGSAGVLVFDAATLSVLDTWPPTADFVSVAVSADGEWVYAAGSPRVGADGRVTSQPASITVFDAATGDIHLIAGQLGRGMLFFPSTVLP